MTYRHTEVDKAIEAQRKAQERLDTIFVSIVFFVTLAAAAAIVLAGLYLSLYRV